MKLTFIDTTAFNYDTVDYPLHHPLGAGNSAICYLGKELAKLGHEVTIFNGFKGESESHGVSIRNLGDIADPAPFLDTQDIAIACSGAIGQKLRDAKVKIPLILWTQHAPDQPAMQPLRNPQERYSWNAVAYVSEWQKKMFETWFGMPPDRGKVLPNGVSPAFAEMEPKPPWYLTQGSLEMFYTSTPFRGLTQLLTAWPLIKEAVPHARLSVCSSMNVYQKQDDDFGCLYELCNHLPGVEYIGSQGQADLAAYLACCDALVYPSSFAEGLCVAMLEAMAVGAEIFTTTLGALPESSGGHAKMIDIGDGTARRFAEMVIEGIRDCERDPEDALARRAKRIAYIKDKFIWSIIAKQWDEWLTTLSSTATGPLKIAS